jgi:antitoxin ParD1/3/4
MSTMNVSLTPQLEDLIRKKVDSGRYGSASEVVREAVRLLDVYEGLQAESLRRLHKDIQEGLDDLTHGRVREFDPEDVKRRGKARLQRKRR